MKKIDLYGAYLEKTREAGKKSGSKKLLLVIAALVVLFALIAGWQLYRILDTKQKMAVENSYITDPANIAAYDEAVAAEDEIIYYESYASELEITAEAFAKYPELGRALFNDIDDACAQNVSIIGCSYSLSDGMLMLNARATGVTNVPEFIRRLETKDRFLSVEYDGYGISGSSTYDFVVVCVLSEGNGE